ncbi:MAG: fibronectin type III domain-containing protein [Caldilineaceae bacterium]|nr:fibronectin type III domain-containing protein [Caldilineaceae bacterium]
MALSSLRARALLVALLLAAAVLSRPNRAAAQLPAPTLSAQPAAAAVNLTWTEIPGAHRYQLITWWDADTGWQEIGGDNLTAAAFNHTGLTIGTTYYYRIRAFDADGRHGPWSEQVFAAPHADLAAPKLSAQPATAAVALTWTEVPDAARYQLIAWWDADTGWQQIGGDNLTAAAYTHTNLTAGTTYYYRIRARNTAGQPGPWSQQRSATASGAQPSPTTTAATLTPTFTPTAAPLSPAPTPTATPTTTAMPAPSATPTSTPPAARPQPDSSHTLVVSDLQPPVLTARAAGNTVTLSWTPIDGAARYELTSWTEAGGWQPIGGDNLTGNSYNHPGPTAAATDFYVRAVSASGDPGPWSEPVSVTPTDTPQSASGPTSTPTATPSLTPTAPSPSLAESALPAPVLTAAASGLTVHLSWSAVDGAVRYQLLSWTSAAGHVSLGGDSLTAAAYDHTGLTAGTTYFYWVSAVSASGQVGPWSRQVYATVTGEGSSASHSTHTSTPTPTATPTPTPPAAQSSTTPTPTSTAAPDTALASSEFAPPVLTAEAKAGTIEIRWNAVSGAVRYNLLTWWDAAVGWQDIGGDNLTAATFTHTTVVPGTTYFYTARAVNAAGETTDWSTYATAVAQSAQSTTSTSTPTATPSVDPTVTPTPTPTATPYTGPVWDFVTAANITGTRQGSTVTLSWNPSPGAVHYNIYHCLSVGDGIPVCRFSLFFRSAYELVARDLTATIFRHEGILRPPPGTTYAYYYRVQACFIPDCPILTRPTATATPPPTSTPTAAPTPTPTAAASGLSAPVVNLAAVDGAIEVRWNAVPGAVRYILISWWDAGLAWQDIGGGDLTATAFTHSDLTPGLTYYYSVRAVNAAGETGPWSTYPSIAAPAAPAPTPTPTPLPHVSSPPYWLSLHPYYTKYLDAGGIPVVSSSDVSDEEFYQVRDTFLAMLSDRPDLLKTMNDHGFRLLIYPLRFEKGGLTSDLPEFRGLGLSRRVFGAAGRTPYGWVAGGPEVARHCNRVMIHEIAHLIEDAIRLQPGGDRFIQKLNSAYQAAMLRGLWQDRYASTNALEYWAELVLAWLTPSQFAGWLGPGYHKLADYDPVGADLVAEVLGNPTPLTFCEIQRFDLQGTVTGPDSRTPLADSYILQLSMRSPANGNRLLGTSTSVRRSDRTFSFERLSVEDHFLASAGAKPHIVIGIYRYDSAGNPTCPSAAFLAHDGSLVRTTDQAQWQRIQVTGSHITGLALAIPPNFDWTPLHTCI